MDSANAMNLKLAMEEPWYKEYWTFLMVPVLTTAACCFIPLFNGEQGMNSMAMLPLTAACSYGHTLSPRRPYYEKSWGKIMAYHEFILASAKRALLFAVPPGVLAWILALFLNGKSKELTMFFEAATWGIATGIFICSLISYIEETFKLKKKDHKSYIKNLNILFKWIVPPTIIFSALLVSKIYILIDILHGRP
jgi:hypothetical protein